VSSPAFATAFGSTETNLGVGISLSPISLTFGYTPPNTTVSDGSASWKVKSSLQNYTGEGYGRSLAAVPPATRTGNLPFTYHYPVESGDFDPATGVTDIQFDGAMVIDYPDHCFKMTIADPHVVISLDEATMYGDLRTDIYTDGPYPAFCEDMADDAAAADDVAAFTLDISHVDPVTAAGVTTWADIPVTLTPAGVPFFAGFYGAGTSFDPLTVSYNGPGGKPIEEQETFVDSGHVRFDVGSPEHTFSSYGFAGDTYHPFVYNPVDERLYFAQERNQENGSGPQVNKVVALDPETLAVADSVTTTQSAANGLPVGPYGELYSQNVNWGSTVYMDGNGALASVDTAGGVIGGKTMSLPNGDLLKLGLGFGADVSTSFYIYGVEGQAWGMGSNYSSVASPQQYDGYAINQVVALSDGTLIGSAAVSFASAATASGGRPGSTPEPDSSLPRSMVSYPKAPPDYPISSSHGLRKSGWAEWLNVILRAASTSSGAISARPLRFSRACCRISTGCRRPRGCSPLHGRVTRQRPRSHGRQRSRRVRPVRGSSVLLTSSHATRCSRSCGREQSGDGVRGRHRGRTPINGGSGLSPTMPATTQTYTDGQAANGGAEGTKAARTRGCWCGWSSRPPTPARRLSAPGASSRGRRSASRQRCRDSARGDGTVRPGATEDCSRRASPA
jgi:hypothetical protein